MIIDGDASRSGDDAVRESCEEATALVCPMESDALSFGIVGDGIEFVGREVDFSGFGDFVVDGLSFVSEGGVVGWSAEAAAVALVGKRTRIIGAPIGRGRESFDDACASETRLFFEYFGGSAFARKHIGDEKRLPIAKGNAFATFDKSNNVKMYHFMYMCIDFVHRSLGKSARIIGMCRRFNVEVFAKRNNAVLALK